MSDITKNLMLIAIFIISMVLIFVGQKNIGYVGLATELIGLAGLLAVLFIYNRRYK